MAAPLEQSEGSYRLMVTGSREFSDRSVVRQALKDARTRAGGRHIVVHGAAKGADTIAAQLADVSRNASPEAWPALWRRAPEGLFPDNDGPVGHDNPRLPPYYRDEALYQAEHQGWSPQFDRRAGLARNEAMLCSGVEEVLAFLHPGAANRGTRAAIAAAERLGIPVRVFEG